MCFDDKILFCGVVFMGNFYCVIEVENVDIVDVLDIGLLVESYECFFERVNVGFM